MTMYSVNKIGLVSHYSPQGNWAFTLAFELARRNLLQLNIFCFPESSYTVPFDNAENAGEDTGAYKKVLIDEERKLREFYDPYLGEYEEVGFKLCTRDRHNFDLRSCLRKKDFQVLVIPYISKEMQMDDMPIEEFAYVFTAPVILVGPERETEYSINSPAKLLADTSMVLPAKFRDPLLVREIRQGHGYYSV